MLSNRHDQHVILILIGFLSILLLFSYYTYTYLILPSTTASVIASTLHTFVNRYITSPTLPFSLSSLLHRSITRSLSLSTMTSPTTSTSSPSSQPYPTLFLSH